MEGLLEIQLYLLEVIFQANKTHNSTDTIYDVMSSTVTMAGSLISCGWVLSI
jgi:hypothetical protein